MRSSRRSPPPAARWPHEFHTSLCAGHRRRYRWDAVERLRYKEDGSAPFKDVTRQVLFEQPDHAAQLRYFEIAPGGYSTLERHQHTHAVLILRGHGTVRIGTRNPGDRRTRSRHRRSARMASVPCRTGQPAGISLPRRARARSAATPGRGRPRATWATARVRRWSAAQENEVPRSVAQAFAAGVKLRRRTLDDRVATVAARTLHGRWRAAALRSSTASICCA